MLWWAGARGSCSRCHDPIGVIYRLVEPVTGAAWVGAAWLVGAQWTLAAYLWMVTVTVALSFVDLRSYRLPNRVLVPGTAVGAVLLAGGALLDGRIRDNP